MAIPGRSAPDESPCPAPRGVHSPRREPAIRLDVQDLEYSAGFRTLLDKVGFTVLPGECVAVLGPSGAGKSTLIKAIGGFLKGYDGKVSYDGVDLTSDRAALRRRIGYVPQDDIVHPSLTVAQELGYAAQLRMPDCEDEAREKRVKEVLATLELDHVASTRIGNLSGGQRKRVSVGVELLTGPPVLFLDEPTSGLDPALEQKMMALFAHLAREGRAVMVTTHVMESLAEVQLVLVLVQGNLAFFGPPKGALNHFGAASFSRIYGKLEERPAKDWRARFRETPEFQRYVVERRKGAGAPAPPAPEPREAAPAAEVVAAKAAAKDAPPEDDDDLDSELAALKEEVRG
jgi:ABC-type multidrug transport system ATPase subunit